MIIATLQAMGTLKPELSLHGGIIKIDLGALLLEMDVESFVRIVGDLEAQAAKYDYLKPIKK